MARLSRRTRVRKSAGIVLAMMIGMSYFSPAQETIRTLPGRLSLTVGDMQTLTLSPQLTLTPVEGQIAVASSEDETLRDKGAVNLTSETSGTAELMLSLLGILPIRTVEVEIGEEKTLIPGGMALGIAMRTACWLSVPAKWRTVHHLLSSAAYCRATLSAG